MKHSPKNLEPNLEWFEFETATVSLEQAELCIRQTPRTAQQFVESLSEKIGLAMVKVPSGSFVMGSSRGELDRQMNEGPQHRVILSEPFFMAKYPITKTQWNVVSF